MLECESRYSFIKTNIYLSREKIVHRETKLLTGTRTRVHEGKHQRWKWIKADMNWPSKQ